MTKSYRICVFGSSAATTNPRYVEASYKLGKMIAANGCICVNGAGKTGVMGGVNDGCFENDGKVKGVIHKMFMLDSGEDSRIKDMVVVDGWDLSERKTQLFVESDCVIIMPGGVGTFDEMWDGVSSKSLKMKGLNHTPIVVCNLDGYYDSFLAQMHRAKQDGILYHDVEKYFHVVDDVDAALNYCLHSLHSTHNNNDEFQSTRKVQRKGTIDQAYPTSTITSNHQPPIAMYTAITAIVCLGIGIVIGSRLRK